MMGDALAVLLRRRMQALAATAVARLGARVAQRWAGQGEVTRAHDEVRLLGPGVRQRRRGSPGQRSLRQPWQLSASQ